MNRPSAVHFAGLVAISSLAAYAGAQIPPTWSRVASAGPGTRTNHAIAHDALRGATVLFGGRQLGGGTLMGDTWEWNGSVWTPRIFAIGPAPRDNHCMAYHAATGKTVLFGGCDGGTSSACALADTWEWNGIQWQQVSSAVTPPARSDGAMAYAPALGGMLLFGGETNGTLLGDLWLYDGTAWSEVVGVQHPQQRASHSLAFDSLRSRLVMFGGTTSTGPVNELWEFDGTSWVLRTPSGGPAPRHGHGMVYDSTHHVSVLYGGAHSSGAPAPSDTWLWNGTHWARYVTTWPGIRHDAAMTFDIHRSRTLLMGGRPAAGPVSYPDTWEWNSGTVSTVRAFGSGCGLSLSVGSGSTPAIGTTCQILADTQPTTQAGPWFLSFGWSASQLGVFTLPLPLDGYGLPGCLLLQSSDVTAPMVQTGPNSSTFSFSIPNRIDLPGLRLFCQGWAFAPGYNAGQTVVSNALELGFGHS